MAALKQVYKVDEIEAFSGLKDAFNKKIFVVLNHDMKELRLYGKNPEFKKERKSLDKRNLQHVIIPEYLEVIDITRETEQLLNEKFPEFKHTQFQVLE